MGCLRGVAGTSPLGGGPGAVARVRAFLPLLKPLPKSQKGHRHTRVPPRHATEGQARVPTRKKT